MPAGLPARPPDSVPARLSVCLSHPSLPLAKDVIVYGAAVSACEKGLQWERSLRFFDEAGQIGLRSDLTLWNAAASACEKTGEWQRALRFLPEMQRSGLRADLVTLSVAIGACQQTQRWEGALHLLGSAAQRGGRASNRPLASASAPSRSHELSRSPLRSPFGAWSSRAVQV